MQPFRLWLMTFQTHEQAARSAFDQVEQLDRQLQEVKRQLGGQAAELTHWKANHQHLVQRCCYLGQRLDLPVDRIPAYQRHVEEITQLRAENAKLVEAIAAATGAPWN